MVKLAAIGARSPYRRPAESVSRLGKDRVERPTFSALQRLQVRDDISDLAGSSLNSGIEGWPVMMPSASGSSRFSTG